MKRTLNVNVVISDILSPESAFNLSLIYTRIGLMKINDWCSSDGQYLC